MTRSGKLLAVGDVAPCREIPSCIFDSVRSALKAGDLLFGQLETNVTNRGARASNAKLAMRTSPENAQAIADAGFGVMSFAGNHCLDWGEEGFADTLANISALNIPICGAGPNITEARKPAIAQCGELKIAFLAYSSILPEGYHATPQRPGCAPMRAHTVYEMIEPDQPGTKPLIVTTPHREDLEALKSDIKAANELADLVIVSFHWGLHIAPVVIADYQYDVAMASIDAGASAVLGHHPHILKAVQFYKGCPVFHSMGNFAIEQPQAFDPEIVHAASFKHLISLHPNRSTNDIYVLPDDTRYTVIVELELTETGVSSTAIRPCWIDDYSVPQLLEPTDPKFEEVSDYLVDTTQKVGLSLKAETRGNRVFLTP